MQVSHIPNSKNLVSLWSGGTTSQIAICPPDAVYSNRDFAWRISSAEIALEQSDFTPLSQYNRILAVLEGDVVLQIDGVSHALAPLDFISFDGGASVKSYGKIRDFNLMCRKPNSGFLEIFPPNSCPQALSVSPHMHHLFFCCGDCTLQIYGRKYVLEKYHALLLTPDGEGTCALSLTSNSPVIHTSIK